MTKYNLGSGYVKKHDSMDEAANKEIRKSKKHEMAKKMSKKEKDDKDWKEYKKSVAYEKSKGDNY